MKLFSDLVKQKPPKLLRTVLPEIGFFQIRMEFEVLSAEATGDLDTMSRVQHWVRPTVFPES